MLTLDRLVDAVQNDAAFRRLRRLQPAGGPGDKIFPPTYPGERNSDPPRHVFEYRRANGTDVLCVLIDSVQSQANRLEEALKHAREAGRVAFPTIAVDFAGTAVGDLGAITALDAPHRVFDAIVRDGQLGGKRFKETEEGHRLVLAKIQNARAPYEFSPTALLFGAWNSTGEGGGLGAKFPRAVVSEIVGIGVATDSAPGVRPAHPSGQRTGSRIDPLGIRSGVRVYKMPNGDWSLEKSSGGKEARPSEINHSNIAPSVAPLGVSVDCALHSFVLSCAALRRLRFTGTPGRTTDADVAAHTALAALGLLAVTAQDAGGYALRSRCDLVPEVGSGATFEIVRPNGAVEPAELDVAHAADLVKAAAGRAAELGLPWRRDDLVLQPQPKLVDLVRLSREMALKDEAEPES